MYYSIQALRALAATLVVVTHSGFAYEAWTKIGTGKTVDVLPWFHTHIFGVSGVHIFFVISGFVISAQRPANSAVDFSINRISRVVPLYWMCTVYFVITGQSQATPDLVRFLRSILFVTSDDPIVAVGWTLNFEMAFYALFCLFVVIMRFSALVVVVVIVSIVFLASLLMEPRDQPFVAPIMLEFAFGVAAFRLHKMPVFAAIAPGFFVIGILVLFSSAIWFSPSSRAGWATTFAWGLPSFVMVLGASSWEARRPNLLRWAPLMMVGGASYSLYLIHWCLLFGNWNLASLFFARTPLIIALEPHVALAVFVLAVILISYVVHRTIELPINIIARSLLRWCVERTSPRTQFPTDAGP